MGGGDKNEQRKLTQEKTNFVRYNTQSHVWECVAESDTLTAMSSSCADGQVPLYDSDGSQWACEDFSFGQDNLLNLINSGECLSGYIPKFLNNSWVCEPDDQIDVLRDLAFPQDPACFEASVARFVTNQDTGETRIECSADKDTDLLESLVDTCGDGFIPMSAGLDQNGNAQWFCSASPDTDLLGNLACGENEVPKFLASNAGNSWFCASDLIGKLTKKRKTLKNKHNK